MHVKLMTMLYRLPEFVATVSAVSYQASIGSQAWQGARGGVAVEAINL